MPWPARRCCSRWRARCTAPSPARMPRRRLINVVTHLLHRVPARLLRARPERGLPVGLAFFLWIGIFSLMVIAQFWAFANDLYTPEDGKRLFALIAFGASSGAVVGAFVCGRLIRIDRRAAAAARRRRRSWPRASCSSTSSSAGARRSARDRSARPQADRPIGGRQSLRARARAPLPAADRAAGRCSSTGSTPPASTSSARLVSARRRGADRRRRISGARQTGAFIGDFYASYFQVVNVAGMLLQLFLVSRIIKHLGVPRRRLRPAGGGAGQLLAWPR